MDRKKKEKEEAEKLIQTLKDIRNLFRKDVKAYLYITEVGIILTGVHAVKEFDEGEEPGDNDIHVSFFNGKREKLKASVTHLDYLG